jgi:RNA polymerase sigma-70 factor (ECF subfamily)
MEPATDRQAAFLERIEQHQGILHRVRSLYAVDPDDGRDLVQEILLQLWRSFPSFRGEAAFSTWMYRVALNTALLRRRRSRARAREESDPEALASVAARPDPANPDVASLYRCIRELPSLDRAIVLLHLEGQSYEEIAGTTGLSRGNVGVRLVRIKGRLRECLAGRPAGER